MKLVSLLFIAVMLHVATGCTTTQVGSSLDAGSIGIDFTFKKVNMCFGPSPEISLTNLPEGTKAVRASLRDLDHPHADHGGGTIKNFTGTVISSGALESYQGPCPSMSEHRRFHYVFKVEALGEDGKVLAVGQAMRECGWVDFQ